MSRSTNLRRRLLPVLCLGAWSGCHAAYAADAAAAAAAGADAFAVHNDFIAANNEAFTQMLLGLEINRQQLDRAVLVIKNRAGELFISEEDLAAARVLLPPGAPVEFKGARYYRLSTLPTISVKVDDVSQTLTLELKPEAFTSTSTNGARAAAPVPTMPSPGMFFNYDVYAAHSGGRTSFAGGLEAGHFSKLGHALSNFSLHENAADGRRKLVRLDTTFTRDRPAQGASLRLGDSISRPASGWGNASRFGGIQYASNFSINPGLVTMPLQTFNAQAALPSTVDVYVNNVFAGRREVPAGPFTINDLPVISGRGNVSMVVRDLAGREQVINQPFYSSPSLLRKGVADFSFEAGALRHNFGLLSNDYGKLFGSGTVRYGVLEALTAETHVQVHAGGPAVAGFNVLGVLPSLGSFNASLAASRSDAGNGSLWAIGFERQASNYNMGLRTQLADPQFVQGGDSALGPRTRRLTSANFGVNGGRAGSASVFYLRQQSVGTPQMEVVSLSYSLNLGRYGMLSATGFKSLSGAPSRSMSLNWSMPLGRKHNVSASHSASRGGTSIDQLQLQRSLDPESGYGYRLQTGRNTPHQAALMLENRVGNYYLEAANYKGGTGTRAAMSGGLAVLGGSAFATRQIRDSFGVVQLPDMPNVRIYVNNQLTGRTDADGNALLPHLRAYDNNVVRVEQADLDLDTSITTLEMKAVPFARSGITLRFPIKRAYSATMTLHTEQGAVLPAGTLVRVDGQTEEFPVGMDGVVYITGLVAQNRLRATLPGGECGATVAFKKAADPLPNLGTFVCKITKP
ncbi:MAG: fimbria/pilus outer membrane usher protein [Pseudomonadota bacterium]